MSDHKPISPVLPEKKRTVIIFDNFGPYHFARLRAAARVCDLKAIQIAGRSADYAWNNEAPADGFKFTTLFQSGTSRDVEKGELARRMNESLDDFCPQIVLLPGWSGKGAIEALGWCVLHHVPAVIMSESTEWDERRIWWKEWVKQNIVGMCTAALVGGHPHKDYMAKLGMSAESIFSGYDVVDNGYFARSAKEVRCRESEVRRKYELPENYFLASARFIEKKNLFRLVRAYARYRKLAESKSEVKSPTSDLWHLVLLGDGPLRSDLCRLISDLHLQDFVLLPGFKQYDELPIYYALAKAFIHASTVEQWGLVVNEATASGLPVLVSNRCGCATDLVQEGVNGFIFDPRNIEQLAQLMLKVSARAFPLSSFGDASRRIIADWSPERFASGLLAAGAVASKRSGRLSTMWDLVFLKIAAHGLKLAFRSKPVALSGKAAGRQLLIFHFGRRKILALPAQQRALCRPGLACYQAHTIKRRLYQHLLSAAISLGVSRVFSSSVVAADAMTIGIDYQPWLDMLQERLGKANLQAVLTWPVQAERQRIYMNIFDERQEICAFVKIAKKLEDHPLLQAGFNALVELRVSPFQRFRLPQPLGHGVFDGCFFAIQQPLPAGVKTLNWRQNADVSPLVRELCVGRKRLNAIEIMQLSWWKKYAAKLPAGCEPFHRELVARIAGGAEVGRVHGDFGPSNMMVEKNAIWLFDWESSHPQGPVLTDVVGYFLSFSVGKAIYSPAHHAQKFAKHFLKNVDPQRRLDIMLALAFRFSSGLPDAEVYLRHCPWSAVSDI
jgi:1,2-diacylglycerol 3-alpha-glucosyltransferase